MKKRYLALLLTGLLAVSLLTGCSNEDNSAESEGGQRDDVNIYCEGVWTDLDPHGAGCTTYTNMYLLNQMYEPLAHVADDGSIEPALATDWVISDDGKTYTFTIREGVKFHNGDDMTAADVAFSLNRAFEAAALQTYSSFVDHAEVVDDTTVNVL